MTEQNAPRRVGTLTMGIALVISGISLCLWQFFPSARIWDLLRFSPALLIVLGVEVLCSNAASREGKLRYDWLGMLLCCIIICFCLCAAALGTVMAQHPEWMGL